jgi:hypothetical protein
MLACGDYFATRLPFPRDLGTLWPSLAGRAPCPA